MKQMTGALSTFAFTAFLGAALPPTAVAAATSDQPITLTVAQWGNLTKDFYAQFTATHPNIKVNVISYSTAHADAALKVKLVGGSAPDVVAFTGEEAASFYAAGLIMPLDDFVKRDHVDLSNVFPQMLAYCQYNGHLYGVPGVKSGGFQTELMWLNKDLFAQAGIALPPTTRTPSQDAWTWATYLADAQKMTKQSADGKTSQWGTVIDGRYDPWIWSNGGAYLNADLTSSPVDQEPAVEALQFRADLRTKYHVAPPSGNGFKTGTVAIDQKPFGALGSTTRAIGDKFDWTVTHFPRGAAGSVNVTMANVLAIPKDSPHPEAAWEFLKWFNSAAAERSYVIDFGLGAPWTKDFAEVGAFLNSTKPPYNLLPNVVGEAQSRPMTPLWPKISSTISSYVNEINAGKTSAQAAATQMAQAIDAILSDGK